MIGLLLSLLLAIFGCAGKTAQPDTTQEPAAATEASEAAPYVPAYDGEIPEGVFGIFDEERYTNEYFGVQFQRDGRWTFYSQQELASLNVGVAETVLRNRGYAYDMYARSDLETLGFTVAIPAVQYGKEMTEAEYAQATKDASARDYAGTDYDVVSDELGTVTFGGEEHACFYLTVAANGMMFYSGQIFLQRGDFVGVVYVSAQSEEGRASLLKSFSGN